MRTPKSTNICSTPSHPNTCCRTDMGARSYRKRSESARPGRLLALSADALLWVVRRRREVANMDLPRFGRRTLVEPAAFVQARDHLEHQHPDQHRHLHRFLPADAPYLSVGRTVYTLPI